MLPGQSPSCVSSILERCCGYWLLSHSNLNSCSSYQQARFVRWWCRQIGRHWKTNQQGKGYLSDLLTELVLWAELGEESVHRRQSHLSGSCLLPLAAIHIDQGSGRADYLL